MIDQAYTFEPIAKFLERITRNNNDLRGAIDIFVERLETLEQLAQVDLAGKLTELDSTKIERTPEVAEFFKAIERYQVANILANQALTVAGNLAKSIAGATGKAMDRKDTPPAEDCSGESIE